MGFPKSVISFGVLAAAASANASILGYSGTNYLVVDGSRRYSVMDVYVNCSNAFDKCVNYYGQNLPGKNGWVTTTMNGVTNANDSATATNGAAWVHSNGTGWMPSSNANANAWDSFVTVGARSQSEAQSSSAITADPYFVNGNTAGAGTIQGGYNNTGFYVGAGWYTASPLYTGDIAGTYADKRMMLGRFTIDVTDKTSNSVDVVTMQMHGEVTFKVNGTSIGGGTTTQPTFTMNATYSNFVVPTPGAIALVGLAGLVSRRRKA